MTIHIDHEFQKQVDRHSWFHSIDFGNGVVSKGAKTLEDINLEAEAILGGINLSGLSVMDIGAWNGFYTFESKRRSATRVLATDHFTWNHPLHKGREAFEFARCAIGLDVEAQDIDVPDIRPESVGSFNVVLFLGVFYHLFDAPTLTKQIARCASELLILETHQDALTSDKPAMVFYPGATLAGDASNWWGPNPLCVYEMLREVGFRVIFYQDHPLPRYSDPQSPTFRHRGIYHAFRSEEALRRLVQIAPPSWQKLSEGAPALRALPTPAEREIEVMKASRPWRWTKLLRQPARAARRGVRRARQALGAVARKRP